MQRLFPVFVIKRYPWRSEALGSEKLVGLWFVFGRLRLKGHWASGGVIVFLLGLFLDYRAVKQGWGPLARHNEDL